MKTNIALFSILFFSLFLGIEKKIYSQNMGISNNSAVPDNSAMLDIFSTTKGFLLTRMTTVQRDAIPAPAEALMIFNTTTKCYEGYVNNVWNTLWCPSGCNTPATPGVITGSISFCANQAGVTYSIAIVPGATSYTWTYPSGASITSGQGTTSIIVTFGSTSGNISVTASNACGTSSAGSLATNVTATPAAPTAGTNTPSATQIVWNWNTVSGATGYKWNTVNTYSSATDAGTNTTSTQTGLTCNTLYTLYVWAYNACGNSTVTTLTQTTSSCASCNQVWAASNLDVGTQILGSINTPQTTGTKWCYNDVAANCTTYGGLYDWNNATQLAAGGGVGILCDPCGPTTGNGGIQGLCPSGFHIPSDLEWSRYEYCVDAILAPIDGNSATNTLNYFQTTVGVWRGSTTAGVGPADKMKATPNTWNGTNTSGFNALPAGGNFGGPNGFSSQGTFTMFWSATDDGAGNGWERTLGSTAQSWRNTVGEFAGFSVRCLRD